MTAPALELQKAILGALTGDPATTGLVGQRVYDHAPADVPFPYMSFGRTSIYDWSTGTENGTEQLFTLHVWSKARGKTEALRIMDRAQAVLDDAALVLDGHSLVNLRLEFSEVRHDDDISVYHGLLRFRAVTEPAT